MANLEFVPWDEDSSSCSCDDSCADWGCACDDCCACDD